MISREVGIIFLDHARDRFLRVGRQPENIEQHGALRQRLVLRVEAGRLQRRDGEIGGVVAVEDGEIAAEPELVGVAAQEPVRHGVKRPAPDARDVCGSRLPTRSSISREALFVKVSSRMFSGSTPFSIR